MSGFNVSFPFGSGGKYQRYSTSESPDDDQYRRPTFEKPNPEDIDSNEIPFYRSRDILISCKTDTFSRYQNIKDATEQLLGQLNDTKLIQQQITYIKDFLETFQTTTDQQKKKDLIRLFFTICKTPCAYPIHKLLIHVIMTILAYSFEEGLACIYFLIQTNHFIINTLEKKCLYEECTPHITMITDLISLSQNALPHYRNGTFWHLLSLLLIQLELSNKAIILTQKDLLFMHSLYLFIEALPNNKKKQYKQELRKLIDYYKIHQQKQPFLLSLIKMLFHRFITRPPHHSISLLQKDLNRL
jgi:hypothetical protein